MTSLKNRRTRPIRKKREDGPSTHTSEVLTGARTGVQNSQIEKLIRSGKESWGRGPPLEGLGLLPICTEELGTGMSLLDERGRRRRERRDPGEGGKGGSLQGVSRCSETLSTTKVLYKLTLGREG